MKKVILFLVLVGAATHFVSTNETENADASVAKTKERIWVASRSANS